MVTRFKPHVREESAQVLVLFSFALVALLMCIMMVVDVGFFMEELHKTQNAADAAALAGAQELPASPANAEAVALDYLTKNGLTANDVTITFECTSQVAQICDESAGKYDTIVVKPKSRAPAFFGGVLRLLGAEGSCWVNGCPVQAEAAGCRGACGPIGSEPVDAVMIRDHSYSMSPTDQINARDAIRQVFTDFDYRYQRVGLALTPPVTPTDNCDSINDWPDAKVWLPAPLTNTFQGSPHILNTTSPPVYVNNCVDRPDTSGGELPFVHTNIGEPLKAATDEIAAHGRANVKKAIIMVTDGAANVYQLPTQASTGMRFCTAQTPVTSSAGDNNGFETNAAGGCADDASTASDVNSGTSTSTVCSNTGKDRHNFWGFGSGTGIPSGATIGGITVRLDAWAAGAGTKSMCVQLSWNGGASWTTAKAVTLGPGQLSLLAGSTTDTWGRTWSLADLSSNNLRVRLTNVAANTSSTFYVDAVAVDVAYSYNVAPSGALGPCHYAAQQAATARAMGIEIYVIAFGANDRCSWDQATSPWYNVSAVSFLQALARTATTSSTSQRPAT